MRESLLCWCFCERKSMCKCMEIAPLGADWILFTNCILSQSNYISISCMPCGLLAVRTVQIPHDNVCLTHAYITTRKQTRTDAPTHTQTNPACNHTTSIHEIFIQTGYLHQLSVFLEGSRQLSAIQIG